MKNEELLKAEFEYVRDITNQIGGK